MNCNLILFFQIQRHCKISCLRKLLLKFQVLKVFRIEAMTKKLYIYIYIYIYTGFFLGCLRGGISPPLKFILPPLSFSIFSKLTFFNTKAIKRDKYSSRLSSPILGFSSIVKAIFFPLHDRLLLRLLAFNSQYF